jgi:hypothetical protein
MAFIAETFAERHLIDINTRQTYRTKPMEGRIQRLRDLEQARREIMNHHMSQVERMAKLEILRRALEAL